MIKRQGNVVLDAFNMILQIISQLLVVRFTDLNITLINKNKITPTFSSTIWLVCGRLILLKINQICITSIRF